MGIIKSQEKSRQVIREYHRMNCLYTNPHTAKTTKWQASPHTFSILTLNVNVFNSLIKSHCLVNWIKKEDRTICCLQETDLTDRNKY
jgi:hypothetical protein